MLRSILVPLDGSPVSEKALPVATRLARAEGAVLHLLMVYDPTQGIGPFAEFGPPSVLLMEELERREATYLARTAARLRKESRLRVRLHHPDGIAGRAIGEVARAVKADLLVMASHGRGALGRVGLGSVAEYVVRHADRPVLVVPAEARPPRGLPGRRVLVPLDLSAESSEVLRVLPMLARARGGTRVTLLHVLVPIYALALPAIPYPITQDLSLTELRLAQAREKLARIKTLAARKGLSAVTRLVSGVRPAAAILDVLHRGTFDLIALTTHGYGGFRRLLLGSVASKVIRNARKPVLIMRPVALPRQRRPRRRRARK